MEVLALGALLGYVVRESFNPIVQPGSPRIPIELPNDVARNFDPPSTIPWGETNAGEPLPQAGRSLAPLYRSPQIWLPRTEVISEGYYPKVDRDPLYPEDLKAYDTLRSRSQKLYKDSGNRNFQFANHHQPYLAQNKTHQEVSQTWNLAGRQYNPYTTGGQDKNGVSHIGKKDPTFGVVRQIANVWGANADDRSTYQAWTKTVKGELVDQIMQEPVANLAVINNPNERIQPTKLRDFPKYLNAAHLQHGWSNQQAREQPSLLMSPQPLKTKKLLLVGDQGFSSSQFPAPGGHQNNALKYPTTGRRREILPEVTFGGLYNNHGTGRALFDQNSGNPNVPKTNSSYAPKRLLVPKMTDGTKGDLFVRGEGGTFQSVWEPKQNPAVDFVRVGKGEDAAWMAQATPKWQVDEFHALEVPLLR